MSDPIMIMFRERFLSRIKDITENEPKLEIVYNPILPGPLNTRWTGGGRILPPNSLVFYPRSIKFGM